MKRIILRIFSGLLSSPIAIAWFALMSIVFNAVYDNVVAPMAALYGRNLPDPPFWHWIVFCMLLAFFEFMFYPNRKNNYTPQEQVEIMGKRIGLATCFFMLSYLIKWIWL